MKADSAQTYLNPVYRHTCPDPFVMKVAGEYWCYYTGIQEDGGCFGILHSPDLIHWQRVGSAMQPLPGGHTCYWAPEVTYDNGRFYMYYSVGNETYMHIRVAVADNPAGPFVDSGHRLTNEDFAIDAHVFQDEDGQRFLFYATDFLDHPRVGTGTVYDRMLDLFTLAGKPQPVTRARYDWQIYDPKRANKGGVQWHTIEGPFVLKHHGRYYQMFSGGNWQNKTYGVSYAIADDIRGPDEWQQTCDGEQNLPILRSDPDQGVIGPGHNSVVRGPNNRELFIIYHRWQPETEERVLAVDRLMWVEDRLQVLGPSVTPQPAPLRPLLEGFAGQQELRLSDGEAQVALPALQTGDLVLEVTLRAAAVQAEGTLGVSLSQQGSEGIRLTLPVDGKPATLRTAQGDETVALPPNHNPLADHLLRVEITPQALRLELDGLPLLQYSGGGPQPDSVRFFARGCQAVFTALEVS